LPSHTAGISPDRLRKRNGALRSNAGTSAS